MMDPYVLEQRVKAAKKFGRASQVVELQNAIASVNEAALHEMDQKRTDMIARMKAEGFIS